MDFTTDMQYDSNVFKQTRASQGTLIKLFNDTHYSELQSIYNFYPHFFIWPSSPPPPGIYRMRFDASTSAVHTPSVWKKGGTVEHMFSGTEQRFYIQHGKDYGNTTIVQAVFCRDRAILFVKQANKC